MNEGAASPSTRAKRRAHRRVTRHESRYHSGITRRKKFLFIFFKTNNLFH